MSGPGAVPEESQALPAATVTLMQGSSFTICESSGDICDRGAEGLFVADTRTWAISASPGSPTAQG
jgi:hypothetical protein